MFAPSAGVGRKLDEFNLSITQLKNQGFEIKLGSLVEVNDLRSGSGKQRAEELSLMARDPEVKALLCAAGGDFLIEMLPYVNFEELAENPKWMMGYSDPTSLLYILTTKYDVATLYGANAGSFDLEELPEWMLAPLEVLQGNSVVQKSLKYCDPQFRKGPAVYETENHWKSFSGDLNVTGRCIGGCLDSLKDLFGTPYDATRSFIDRYQSETLIWYFDIFSMSAENVYRTLLQMKSMGAFRSQDVVIAGRVLFPSSETGMTYEDAFKMALECKVVMEADIGHTYPRMVMINGAVAQVSVTGTQGCIAFDLSNQ
ncbi:MAG: LD-carboxypeptidase [Erysipelotrichaceae bacterium]|nr:LD-carboxypeptidase [Erysipelotrichaceae bacterium]